MKRTLVAAECKEREELALGQLLAVGGEQDEMRARAGSQLSKLVGKERKA